MSCELGFVATEKRTLLFWIGVDGATAARDDCGVSAAAVSWVAFSAGTALLREISVFSGPTPPSVPAFGVTPEGGKEGRVSFRLKAGRGNREERGQLHIQPNASASAVNRANTNSCESRESNTPSSTSMLLVHATVIAGAIAEVPC